MANEPTQPLPPGWMSTPPSARGVTYTRADGLVVFVRDDAQYRHVTQRTRGFLPADVATVRALFLWPTPPMIFPTAPFPDGARSWAQPLPAP